jgi:hypothetical protein
VQATHAASPRIAENENLSDPFQGLDNQTDIVKQYAESVPFSNLSNCQLEPSAGNRKSHSICVTNLKSVITSAERASRPSGCQFDMMDNAGRFGRGLAAVMAEFRFGE